MDRLTIPEYELLMEAAKLKIVDKHYFTHLLAWLGLKAKAEKKVGKNKRKVVYDRFDKFFNYESELEKVKGTKKESKFSGIGKFLKKGE